MLEIQATQVVVMVRDPLLCAGLIATLRAEADIRIGEPEPIALSDVFVTDYEQGLALIASAKSEARAGRGPVPKVLILTPRDSEPEIRYALEHGARGYLTVGCGLVELVEAVRTLSRGSRYVGTHAARRLADSVASEWLTARETDVLRLLVEGLGNKAIAKKLGIAIGTVKSHLKAIFQKLEASSRTQVAAVADRRGLLSLPSRAPAALHPQQPTSPMAWTPPARALRVLEEAA